MVNTDKNKKKYRRKIRIRLANPNIPDSYVCEIFDSSLENEERSSVSDETEFEEKPKNYFEILMPKKLKKNDSANQNKGIKSSSVEEFFERNNLKNQKNVNFFTKPENVRIEKSKCETDSSEDENLFQSQKNFKLKNFNLKEENDCIIEVSKEVTNNKEIISKNVISRIEPPKVGLLQKNALGILSYFSKTQPNPKSEKNFELKEISEVQHSIKTCKIVSSVKPIKQQKIQKTHQSENEIAVNGINKENVKLAPLFYKKENRVVDAAVQKARLEFLYKSSSSIVKKSVNKVSESNLNFPTISHVQQRNDSVYWLQRDICLPLPEVSYSEDQAFKSHKKFSLQIKHFNGVANLVENFAFKINKESLCKLKSKYLKLNLDQVIDGFKDKKEKFLPRTEKIKKSKIKVSQQDSSDSFDELDILWTEKYKPKSCEILGNENVLRKMKKWLQSWKLFDEELKALVKTSQSSKNQIEEDDNSDDDFIESDCENYGLKAPGNVCIISGPNGCGKTALVYALASELEFGVLELNASSKRTGKKVLSDIQEATQSHKVHHVNLIQADAFQNKTKKKKNIRKKKNIKLESKKIIDQSNDSKISLILIEDADIVFDEHDEGFFSAITSLVQTSKRPLIFLTNEPNSHYLYNLKTEQCLILEMNPPNFYISCAILDIVSSLEGASFDKEILESVVRLNNFDLRRSLLFLQFWIHSRENPADFQKKFDLGQLWWGLSKFLYKQDIKHFVKPKSCKRKRLSDLFDSSDDDIVIATKKFKPNTEVLNNSLPLSSDHVANKLNSSVESYFKVLDLLSVLDGFSLSGSQEPIPGFECKSKDSLSLEENMEEATWARKNFAEEISSELVALSTLIFTGKEKINEKRKLNFMSPCWEEIRWRNSQENATQELSVLDGLQKGRDKKSLYLDYLPILRYICRIERNRSEMNPKRKNRFYHYLKSLGVELTNENLEINCDIFNR